MLLLLELARFIMERKMLLGIKRQTERTHKAVLRKCDLA